MNRKQRRAAAKAEIAAERLSSAFIKAVEHHHAGRTAEARACYLAALAQTPDHALTHYHLGVLAWAEGDIAAAVEHIGRAVALAPDNAPANISLAAVLREAGQTEQAIAAGRRAQALQPDNPTIYNDLGIALLDLGRLEESAAACRIATVLNPSYAEAFNNLGNALAGLGRLDEAIAVYRKALELKPVYPGAWSNLGNVLSDNGQLPQAVECYRFALEQQPDYPKAYSNLGHTLKAMGRIDESIAACRKAVALQPDYARAHGNLAFSLLMKGDFAEGWREFEWRWKIDDNGLTQRDIPLPLWQGDPLEGRTLLLHSEQGLGDVLQFCRFAGFAAERGGRVVLVAYRPLVRLLGSLAGVAQVVAGGDPLPPFDCHLPLMSLPRVLGTTLDSIPADIPYLRPDPDATAAWGRRLGALPGLKVGLVWAGDPRPHDVKAAAIDRRRSVDPSRLRPLFKVPGISMVSLQMGAKARHIDRLEDVPRPLEIMAEVTDFADTAAIVANLDLVITVDTSMVHLAGAIGKPVWVLSRFDGCWRWLTDRDDSPWYPTLRLFRLKAPDAWEETVARVAAELEKLRG